MTWVDAVLEFWFSELTESDWWKKNDATDAQIRARFGPLHQRLAAGNDLGNLPDARSTLAAVIVLDQFSRNLYRGSPQAFAVAKISTLGHEAWTKFALAHQAVIDRFGRFPHRNAVLGRESTPEEIAALQEPMTSF